MVTFSIEKLALLMKNMGNIRNICMIGQKGHGISTIRDCLSLKGGIVIVEESKYRRHDHDECRSRMIVDNCNTFIYYEKNNNGQNDIKDSYLINVVNSSLYTYLTNEFASLLRVTDSVVIVIDCIEGFSIQTENKLRQALLEKNRPVLMINKIDRAILELQQDGESIYQLFLKTIHQINTSMYGYEDNQYICPTKGTVAFGSGQGLWGFTLTKFTHIYSKKFGLDVSKLIELLWGDNYYDSETQKWTMHSTTQDGRILVRGFVQFIIEPIIKLTKSIMDGNQDQMIEILNTIGLTLLPNEKELKGKSLLKTVLSKWINLADCLLDMVIIHLPSPKEAQKYRIAHLYEGPQDDICAEGIRNCDPDGPLMIYISRLIPNGYRSRFFAFGRVFSGTVKPGQKVKIMGPEYKPGQKVDLIIKPIQSLTLMMSSYVENISEVSAGNIVGLIGVDQYLLKAGTISDCEEAHNIRTIKSSSTNTVMISVGPKNPVDLPKLLVDLKTLSKAHPGITISQEETGELTIAGNDELHLQAGIHDLQTFYAQCEFQQSDPFISYKETITKVSRVCMTKTPNKHNRLYCTAQPLSEDLCEIIETKENDWEYNVAMATQKIHEEFGWEKDDAYRLWAFGPEDRGPNVLIDLTKNVKPASELKDGFHTAFQWVTKQGILSEEPLRQVRINLIDASLHVDAIHRGRGQMIPAARRAYYACLLTAEPRIQEPMFLVEIIVPKEAIGSAFECLSQRNGIIIQEKLIFGTPLTQIRAYVPGSSYLGIDASLTAGKVLTDYSFSHWDVINSDPLDENSQAFKIMMDGRKRKGLREKVPNLADYMDNL